MEHVLCKNCGFRHPNGQCTGEDPKLKKVMDAALRKSVKVVAKGVRIEHIPAPEVHRDSDTPKPRPTQKEDYNAYMADYMRRYRARKKEERT